MALGESLFGGRRSRYSSSFGRRVTSPIRSEVGRLERERFGRAADNVKRSGFGAQMPTHDGGAGVGSLALDEAKCRRGRSGWRGKRGSVACCMSRLGPCLGARLA
jgi:hypothetical protein